MITMPVELYTDGSCLRNPGAGGYAYIIRFWDAPEGSDVPEPKIIEVNQGYRLTTNNRMEIMGGICGMQAIIEKINKGEFVGVTQINLATDSEYFCNAINKKWIQKWEQNNWMTAGWENKKPAPVKNKDLWQQVIQLQNTLRSMGINWTVTHVKGHNGHEFNERADKLAVEASNNGNNHLIDTVYEQTMTSYNRR
ncbi:MAG: ribonuclease HI [Roseburia sp.]|nr:ribonuclease HI [Roseburia sp.]